MPLPLDRHSAAIDWLIRNLNALKVSLGGSGLGTHPFDPGIGVHTLSPLTVDLQTQEVAGRTDDTYNIGATDGAYKNYYMGSGSFYLGTAEDTAFSRVAANTMGMAAGDSFRIPTDGQLKFGTDVVLDRGAADRLDIFDSVLITAGGLNVNGGTPVSGALIVNNPTAFVTVAAGDLNTTNLQWDASARHLIFDTNDRIEFDATNSRWSFTFGGTVDIRHSTSESIFRNAVKVGAFALPTSGFDLDVDAAVRVGTGISVNTTTAAGSNEILIGGDALVMRGAANLIDIGKSGSVDDLRVWGGIGAAYLETTDGVVSGNVALAVRSASATGASAVDEIRYNTANRPTISTAAGDWPSAARVSDFMVKDSGGSPIWLIGTT